MSSNNQLIIFKKGKKWFVEHRDMDTGKLPDKFQAHDSLESAVKTANRFIKYCEEEGYGVEYGLRINV